MSLSEALFIEVFLSHCGFVMVSEGLCLVPSHGKMRKPHGICLIMGYAKIHWFIISFSLELNHCHG
jgi:hypothetical protein